MFRYFAIYKPYQVLSQFTSEDGKKCLKDIYDFPRDVYPIGRLDFDSEGLLLITNDNQLNHLLAHPKFEHTKQYYLQVEGKATPEAIKKLQNGVEISIKGTRYLTKKAYAEIINEPVLPERIPPIRYRKSITTSWLKIAIREGKNRQLRRMVASVGLPALRVVRYSIGNLHIGLLGSLGIKEFSSEEIYNLCQVSR